MFLHSIYLEDTCYEFRTLHSFRHFDKIRQQGMKERFSHQMKIQKLDLVLKLVGESVKFIQGQTMLGSVRLRAELAIEVADIGYFKIASGNHKIFCYEKRTS